MQESDFIELQTQEGRVSLRMRALYMGSDLCILLDGGQRPHTGAVALAFSNDNENKVKVLCLEHHREDELAKQIAQKIQKQLGITVTCLCGIHIPNISKQEIALVYSKAEELADAFLKKIEWTSDA